MFKIVPGGSVTTIGSFTGTSGTLPGTAPFRAAYLTLGSDGLLYGTTGSRRLLGFGTIFRVGPNDTVATVASFTNTSGALRGRTPRAPLTEAGDGNLYGTTRDGVGAGSVFYLVPGGPVTVFTGSSPGTPLETPLSLGPNGNLFGIGQDRGSAGNGSLFKITPGIGVSIVSGFADTKGSAARSALTAAIDGFLDGTTPDGGLASNGTIFKVLPGSGGVQTVASFTGSSGTLRGAKPWNRLVAMGNGKLYGTTIAGGTMTGDGAVYEVTPGGGVETRAVFDSTVGKGRNPRAELALGPDGRLFGSATSNFSGNGAFYSISLAGNVTALAGTLNRDPYAALQLAGDGELYGITPDGGAFGSVIVVNPADGSVATLSTFTGDGGALPGRVPRSRLTLAADGNLYGTTTGGGADNANAGTIFR